MASFAKHLSTHLYFHMERNHRKQGGRNSQTGSSGFSQSELQHSPSTNRPRSWNKENSHGDLEPGAYSYSSEIVSSYDNPLGMDSLRHISTEHRGSIVGSDWPEDYFSYSPYLLTPDLSSKSRTRRRSSRRYGGSSNRYELCIDDDDEYVQPMREHPRLRPPDPSSPILDRRFLPSTPNSSRSRNGLDDSPYYPDEVDQDCFIVPSHMRGRFLPLKNEMNTLEVADPKVCILIDFRENGSFASQDLPFPSTALRLTPKEWLVSQLNRHRKAFTWVKESQSAIEGLLLMNVERHSQFPFVTYLVTNTIHSDPRRIIVQLRSQTAVPQNSEQLQHTAGYEEVASIVKPSLDCLAKQPIDDRTGYIISAFRVFPGEDREKLERNWLTWTGARQVYKCLPKHLGLRRLTFHKKLFPDNGITYVLMCECSALVEHVTEALVFVDHLRARCCGYTALYRPVDVF
ncbi:uncharacterized protein [Parasteatoda tepidariorum]|uniref:uncharacterized protein isoform X2 n=1 Tax=Parasteatoda tepidariorum TaxID=114398 RepID=UPI00077FCF84|nr:uncharacterized protein LOC107443977 isoform X2 [Parasteatoda tepidariorum]